MEILLIKFIPIVLLLGLGYTLQKTDQINDEVIAGLKYILMNLSIPPVIFMAYVKTDLQSKYFLIFILMFGVCCMMFYSAKFLKGFVSSEYTGWYLTAFENGLLGIPLFTAIWGMEALPMISLLGIGNAIFIWFVYMPQLERKNSGVVDVVALLKSMAKSRVLVCILVGLILNKTGVFVRIENHVVTRSLWSLFEILGKTATPLILLILGYGIKFDNSEIVKTLKYIMVRFVLSAFGGAIMYLLIIKYVGIIDPLFPKIFFAYILLPPPFLLPIFIKDDKKEENFFSNALIGYTFFFLVGLAVITYV